MRRVSTHVPGLCIVLALVALLLLAGAAMAEGTLSVNRWVVGGGGGRAEGGAYALDCTVGQGVVGAVGSAPYALCAGYWCGPGVVAPAGNLRVYLPLVLQDG